MTRSIRILLPAVVAVCSFVTFVPADGSAQGKGKGAQKVDQNGAPRADRRDLTVERKVVTPERKVARTTLRTTRRVTSRGTRLLCADGTWGYTNRGGCSAHDGIAANQGIWTGTPRASARARAMANANSAVARTNYPNTDPTNAIARCVDGTYWHSTTRKGACVNHGGVAAWL